MKILLNCSFQLYRKTGEFILFKRQLENLDPSKQEESYQKEILDQLNQLKGKITHSLRTPLTSVRGFAEILLNSANLTDIQLESIAIILRNELRLEQALLEIECDLINFLQTLKKVK